jgi:hypothetical protein
MPASNSLVFTDLVRDVDSHRPVDQCVEAARTFDDKALRMREGSNGRLFSLAQVPLQSEGAACAEALFRCPRTSVHSSHKHLVHSVMDIVECRSDTMRAHRSG